MRNIQVNSTSIGHQAYNLIEKVQRDINIINSPYPTDGSLFLLDENANVLDKNVDSYPEGTIKAYGFQAEDGKYYAVDAQAIGTLPFGGYGKDIININYAGKRNDYAGEHNTTEIIAQLTGHQSHGVTGAPAAEACRARTFNGKQGFLPALGQIVDFINNHSQEVNQLQLKFSLDTFGESNDNYWSSTTTGRTNSYYISWGTGYSTYTRFSALNVRAFFAL